MARSVYFTIDSRPAFLPADITGSTGSAPAELAGVVKIARILKKARAAHLIKRSAKLRGIVEEITTFLHLVSFRKKIMKLA